MSIRKKTILIVGGMVGTLVIAMVVTSFFLVTGRFARLEVDDTQTQVQLVRNELNTILSQLESIVGDWAPWDDSYRFIQDKNEDYVHKNLSDTTFTNLFLNFMLFYDKEGRLVYSKFYQITPSQTYVQPGSIESGVNRYPALLSHLSEKSSISGVLITPSCPYLVASHPIVTSNFEGPIRGTIVMGRALDAIEVGKISASTKTELKLKMLSNIKTDLATAALSLALINPGAIYTRPISTDQIAGYAKLSDLSGKPALLLEIRRNRDIYRYGFSTWRLNALALAALGLTFILLLMFLLNRVVLTPLTELTTKVNRLTHSPNGNERLEIKSTNEIGRLAQSINGMLTALQGYHAEKAGNEQYLRELFDSINCGVLVIDEQNHQIIDINKTGADLYEGSRDELIGRQCHQLICPREKGDCPITDRKRTIDHAEQTLLKSDGTFLPVLKSVTKVLHQGRPYLIESFFDISNLKKAEASLRESEARYRQFFEEDLTGDFLISMDGRIIDCNPAFTKMLGYDHPVELRSLVVEDHYPSKEERRLIINQLRKKGRLEGIELVIYHRNDQPIYCIGNLIGHFDAEGNLKEVRGYLFDDTKRIVLEKDLRRAQKMEAIGTLAGGIAHDFNNILAGIMGYTEIAMSELPESGATIKHLEKVMRSANRAKDLVHQILAFSRQNEEESHPLALQPIIKEVVKLMRATLPATIEIREKFNSEARVMANPVQIQQMIMNLCTNAAHAMKKTGGSLSITATDTRLDQSFSQRYPGVKPGAYICINVTDTGIGISPDIIDRIFDPFFSTKDKNEATGLGLSVVHGIVSKLRGAITVDTSPSGTTFNIYLPVIEKKAASLSTKQSQPLATGSETIVFIDDEELLVEIGAHILEKLGYRTHAFTNSEKALEYILANGDQIDLIISDMTMPGLTGLAIAKRLQESLPHLPIIICTGYSEEISAESDHVISIKGYVMKPIVIKELAAKIRVILDAVKTDRLMTKHVEQ